MLLIKCLPEGAPCLEPVHQCWTEGQLEGLESISAEDPAVDAGYSARHRYVSGHNGRRTAIRVATQYQGAVLATYRFRTRRSTRRSTSPAAS